MKSLLQCKHKSTFLIKNLTFSLLVLSISSFFKPSYCEISQSQVYQLIDKVNGAIPKVNRSLAHPADGSYREARRSVVSGGIFSIISFDNVPCNGSDGDVGTCYSPRECNNLGGTSNGYCAGNYGVCCTLKVTCGATVTLNNTYFINPGYSTPSTGPLSCSVTVNQIAGASQLYLDMTNFSIRGPSSGVCTNDTFVVKVGTVSYPVLCGVNSNKDYYIPWSSTSGGTATITFSLASGSDPRTWKIRLVQFKPTDSCSCPSRCQQCYRATSGTVQSCNFNSGQGEIVSTNSCMNQCFILPSGYCSVLFTEGTFMLPGTSPSTCTDTYLKVNGNNYCGDTLSTNGMLRANQTTGSSYIPVCFQTGTSNLDMDVGYNLTYTFQTC